MTDIKKAINIIKKNKHLNSKYKIHPDIRWMPDGVLGVMINVNEVLHLLLHTDDVLDEHRFKSVINIIVEFMDSIANKKHNQKSKDYE